MALICFKLVTGEEIITEITDSSYNGSDDTYISIKNSMMIITVPRSEGHSVAFVPFPLHGTQNKNEVMVLPKKSVVYEYEPGAMYVQQHNNQFGAGLVIPSKQLLKG